MVLLYQWPQRESNSCYRRERAMSWPLDHGAQTLYHLFADKENSPSRARTYNTSVNSRVLYHWAIEEYFWKYSIRIPSKLHTDELQTADLFSHFSKMIIPHSRLWRFFSMRLLRKLSQKESIRFECKHSLSSIFYESGHLESASLTLLLGAFASQMDSLENRSLQAQALSLLFSCSSAFFAFGQAFDRLVTVNLTHCCAYISALSTLYSTRDLMSL